MKKRYIATPIVLIAVALTWNIVLRPRTPIATAEDIKSYVAPESEDPRHPIEVYRIGVTGGETEADVFHHLPTTIYPEDKISFVVDPAWGLGTIVHLQRALPITIKDGRKLIPVRTWADTVGELLDDVNRPLGELDKSNFTSNTPLTLNMRIEITRVAKTNVTLKEAIPFETTDKDDPNEYRGVTKVQQAGENGERAKTYEITREDGEEVARKLIKNDVTKQPKNKIVVHGTKIKIGKTATGKATFYDLCCKKVASNTFKKGTVLRLTNLNNGKQIFVTVDDTGAFGPEIVVDLHPSLFQQLGGTIGQGVMQRVLAEEVLNP